MIPQQGDLLVSQFRTPRASLISIGAWLSGANYKWNHVSIVVNNNYVIEALPSGVQLSYWPSGVVGYVPMPVPEGFNEAELRAVVCDLANGYLGASYDWGAVYEDTARIFGFSIGQWISHKPGFTCSALAARVWERAGIPMKNISRFMTPWQFGLVSKPL